MSANNPFSDANVNKLPGGMQMLASIRRKYNECIKTVSTFRDKRGRKLAKVTCVCCKYKYPDSTIGIVAQQGGVKFYANKIRTSVITRT